ncbi:OLC1v1006553C1 [Oldenlandia corymbosa var. corymbosa]|uniref:OLC1v1006553C1 n=1 Tax=Oldenlandia corymbosa var. corymbosa TaxID=529605 RepID=A0AAV1DKA8_OLDCO|nr:OLC1v1006553C1 [Oldenlandia corymbosa var. corymbosa]
MDRGSDDDVDHKTKRLRSTAASGPSSVQALPSVPLFLAVGDDPIVKIIKSGTTIIVFKFIDLITGKRHVCFAADGRGVHPVTYRTGRHTLFAFCGHNSIGRSLSKGLVNQVQQRGFEDYGIHDAILYLETHQGDAVREAKGAGEGFASVVCGYDSALRQFRLFAIDNDGVATEWPEAVILGHGGSTALESLIDSGYMIILKNYTLNFYWIVQFHHFFSTFLFLFLFSVWGTRMLTHQACLVARQAICEAATVDWSTGGTVTVYLMGERGHYPYFKKHDVPRFLRIRGLPDQADISDEH